MIVWRLEKQKFVDSALKGLGAARSPGRWNRHGEQVVYCGQNPSLALLEILVHNEIDFEDLPPYKLLAIDAPGRSMARQDTLPDLDVECTQIGSDWLKQRNALLLRLPSVILPQEWNYVINPNHPAISQVQVAAVHNFGFDRRLFP